MYKAISGRSQLTGKEYFYVEYTDSGGAVTSIPSDEANSDYQAYIAWLEQNSL